MMISTTLANTKGEAGSHEPLFWLAMCFAAGIAAAHFGDLSFSAVVVSCLAAATASAFTAGKKAAVIFLFASFFFAGAAVYLADRVFEDPHRLRRLYDEGIIASGEPVEIAGEMSGGRELTPDGYFFTVAVRSIEYKNEAFKTSGDVRFFANTENEELRQEHQLLGLKNGKPLRIVCRPVREDGFLDPGVHSRKKVLDQKGIDATATLKSPPLVESLGEPAGFGVLAAIYDVREGLIERFSKYFSRETAGVMIASLLGNGHFLDKRTSDIFREGGTFHILVISGLHITFIGGLGIILVRLFTKRRKVQFVVVTASLWIYTLAVGAEVPVVRATVMFTVIFFSIVIHRRGNLLNAFGLCGLLLMAWRPEDLFGASFQLTFVSVGAIIIMAFPLIEKLRSIGNWTPVQQSPFPAAVPKFLKRICETLYWNAAAWEIDSKRNVWSANLFKAPFAPRIFKGTTQKVAAYIFEGVVVSTLVQLWMLPLLVIYFHRVSPVSIILNLWAGFFIALESFAAVAAIAVAVLSDTAAMPLIAVAEIFGRLLIEFQAWMAKSDAASFRVPVLNGFQALVYPVYAAAALIPGAIAYYWEPFCVRSGGRLAKAATLLSITAVSGIMIFASAIVFHPFSEPVTDGRLRIAFLDVGQGDSTLVTFPNGETMLIDGGGIMRFKSDDDDLPEPDSFRVGEAVVSEFLWENGYSRVDHVLATHSDTDHIQGLEDVLQNFSAGRLLISQPSAWEPEMVELLSVAHRRGVEVFTVGRGNRIEIGDAMVELLHPKKDPGTQAGSNNDRSVVVRIIFGERTFLLTGDIEQQAEADIIAAGESVRADVVKVAHHGSQTSSTQAFVDKTKAAYAVIPVGRRSLFGHPHTEVVERWRNSGAEVLTTGESGLIIFSTDGKDLEKDEFVDRFK